MAIALTNPVCGNGGFIVNGTSADASGCEELKAGAAGKTILITHLTINNGASALSHTIGEGETNPGGVDAALIAVPRGLAGGGRRSRSRARRGAGRRPRSA